MKVYLFDIDGTLILSGRAGQDSVLIALSELFGARAGVDSVEFAGRTDRAIMSDLFRLHGIAWSTSNWHRFRQSYLQHLPRLLRQRDGRILPGVGELLRRLRHVSDAHLGLLTGNLQAGAQEKLRHFGLWDQFAFGGFGDDHLSRDEVAREALRNAGDHLQRGVEPADVWVIGDTPSDVQCARAVGAHVLAVATGSYSMAELAEAGPDGLCKDLSDTCGLVELLAGRSAEPHQDP